MWLMKIRIISVGRIKQAFVKAGEGEYLKRLTGRVKVEFVEVDAGKAKEKGSEVARLKDYQAQAVLSHVKEGECLVVLDENGKSFTSVQFADWLHKSMVGGDSQIVFAIGGAYGWTDDVRRRADMVLSLSQLTFPHQLCRLILIEQLYRVFSIMNGSPYHKV